MQKRTLITGANRGIGLSLATLYSNFGWQVFACCRQTSAALAALDVVVVDGVDVANEASIQRISENVGQTKLDLVINNAGMLDDEVLGDINYQSIEAQFAVNALGPLRVSEMLMNNFADQSKLVMITSRMGSIADNTSGGRYGYRMSKAALNIAGVSLAHDLRTKHVAVAMIHPGLVGTDMIGGYGDITPDQAAERIVDRINELTLDNSGSFWHSNGQLLEW